MFTCITHNQYTPKTGSFRVQSTAAPPIISRDETRNLLVKRYVGSSAVRMITVAGETDRQRGVLQGARSAWHSAHTGRRESSTSSSANRWFTEWCSVGEKSGGEAEETHQRPHSLYSPHMHEREAFAPFKVECLSSSHHISSLKRPVICKVPGMRICMRE